MVDGEQVMKNVNVNVKQKRGEIRAMVLECVVVSGCKSIKVFFRLALRGVKAARSKVAKDSGTTLPS